MRSARKRAAQIRQVTEGDVSVLTDTVRDAIVAMKPLTFEERRRVLRWIADYYQIDPTVLAS